MQRYILTPQAVPARGMQPYRMLAAALCLAAGAAGAAGADSADPSGRWLTASGNLEVEIAACGQDLCGSVVKVLANRSMGGPPAAPAASAAAARPLLGLVIMPHFTAAADGQWKGRIYNRERDASYDCTLALAGPDQIRLSIQPAPMLPPTIQFWRRVAGPAPLSDQSDR